MGAWLGRRTEQRVDFREAVRVIWPGKVSGVVARAVNLSPAGILVDAPTPTPCPVGSDVLCALSLPRGPRLLRGRVAHRRVLPSAKVGMGIEFVDLSLREVAELRDVVEESDQKSHPAPQHVKVRFAGTEEIVRARAYPSEGGLRLVTSLPFLKVDTEVELTLAPDVEVGARGWVSSVALERGSKGMPRLLIDVRTDSAISSPTQPGVPHLEMSPIPAPAPIIEPSPEPSMAPSPASSIIEGPSASAAFDSADQTEIVSLERPMGRLHAFGRGTVVGAVGLAAFVAAVELIQNAPRESVTSLASPAIVTQKATAELPPAAPTPQPTSPPVAVSPVAAGPTAAPVSAGAPVAAPPVAPSSDFVVGLTGSFAGSRRYPLSDPDGVAFNLPHAYAAMKVGTYRPDVAGLRSVWVRALPAGGVHLRFYYTTVRPAPRIELTRTGVRVTAP
jgi:hypothetical protein